MSTPLRIPPEYVITRQHKRLSLPTLTYDFDYFRPPHLVREESLTPLLHPTVQSAQTAKVLRQLPVPLLGTEEMMAVGPLRRQTQAMDKAAATQLKPLAERPGAPLGPEFSCTLSVHFEAQRMGSGTIMGIMYWLLQCCIQVSLYNELRDV